jgi:hypothetical protein
VTSSIFVNFFTVIYGWVAFWTILTSVLMLSRRGKNWLDYDVILFRVAVAMTTLAVFFNRYFNTPTLVRETPVSLFLLALLVSHLILAYASASTCIRVAMVIYKERKNGIGPEYSSYPE